MGCSGKKNLEKNTLSKDNESPQKWNPMFWNQGMNKKSWILLSQDDYKIYDHDLSEAHLLGTPPNVWPAVYEDAWGNKFQAQNQTSPAVKMVTLGYSWDQKGEENMGFNYQVSAGNDGQNGLIYSFGNNAIASKKDDLGKLREVGFVFDNWVSFNKTTKVWAGAEHSFRQNYRIGEYSKIELSFEAMIDQYKASNEDVTSINKNWIGSYITADFRFTFFSAEGEPVGSGLLGVIFANPSGFDLNGKTQDAVFWSDFYAETSINRMLLHGDKVGLPVLKVGDKGFKDISIDYIALLNTFFPEPPAGMSFKDAIITGLDIYSATRGENITFKIKNIRLEGVLKN